MAFIDGENGENFMTVLGFPQYGRGTFRKMCEEKRPTINIYLLRKLNELEIEIKELKKNLRN